MKKQYTSACKGWLTRAALLFALFAGVSTAKAQVFQWAKGFQDAAFLEYSNSMAADAAGNAFYAGAFENTLQLGNFSLNAPGYNMYVAKVDPAGNVTWVKNFPNDTFFEGVIYDLETDAAGNVYVTGAFEDSITIGTVGLAAPFLGPDFFLTKIDPAGTIQWVKHGSGDSNDEATSLSLDAAGNIYLTGYTYNAGFDFTYDGDTIPGTNNDEGFLIKTDNNGNMIWGKMLGSDFMEVAVDPTGNGYLTGSFSALTLDLGNGVTLPHQNTGFYSGFVARFSDAGIFQWAHAVQGPMTAAVRVKVDPAGNALAMGTFEESFAYNGATLTGQTGRNDLYLVKIDDTGSPIWAKLLGNLGWDQGGMGFGASPLLEIDNAGNALVANVQEGTALLDSAYLHFPHNDSTFDVAVVKLSPTGSLVWAERVGGIGWERATGLAVSSSGAMYLSGGTEDDSGAGTPYGTLFGNSITLNTTVSGAFMAKLLNEANSFSGTVFLDTNSSGTQDAGEPGLANLPLQVTPTQMLVPTQAGGHYTAYTESGNFQITVPQSNTYYTLSPASHSATFTGLGQADSLNNFALQPMGNSEDLQVSLVQLSAARPGFTYRTRILYKNAGTVAMSGTVKMASDTLLTFETATPANASVSGDTLAWTFSGLQPFETRQITVEWHVDDSSALGTPLRVFALVEPQNTDLTPADNYTEITPIITGSYDPNDKLVSHAQLTTNQVADRQYITYTVRFQNTGTDTAFTVMVRDQLSQLLDLSTLEVLSSSHPFSTTIVGQQTIEWKFSNILLPDSNVNEPASHGYIQYRLKPLNTLSPGQHINTSAGIYFDFNAPVATNITDTEVVLPSFVAQPVQTLQINVFPNPTTGASLVEVPAAGTAEVKLTLLNALGQQVFSQTGQATDAQFRQQLNLQHLPAGIYLLHVQQGSLKATKRLVLQR